MRHRRREGGQLQPLCGSINCRDDITFDFAITACLTNAFIDPRAAPQCEQTEGRREDELREIKLPVALPWTAASRYHCPKPFTAACLTSKGEVPDIRWSAFLKCFVGCDVAESRCYLRAPHLCQEWRQHGELRCRRASPCVVLLSVLLPSTEIY